LVPVRDAAINADTGDYVRAPPGHPGEEWDFDAVQQLILADPPSTDAPPGADAGQQEAFLTSLTARPGSLSRLALNRSPGQGVSIKDPAG
jgi:hypothetical protein